MRAPDEADVYCEPCGVYHSHLRVTQDCTPGAH